MTSKGVQSFILLLYFQRFDNFLKLVASSHWIIITDKHWICTVGCTKCFIPNVLYNSHNNPLSRYYCSCILQVSKLRCRKLHNFPWVIGLIKWQSPDRAQICLNSPNSKQGAPKWMQALQEVTWDEELECSGEKSRILTEHDLSSHSLSFLSDACFMTCILVK